MSFRSYICFGSRRVFSSVPNCVAVFDDQRVAIARCLSAVYRAIVLMPASVVPFGSFLRSVRPATTSCNHEQDRTDRTFYVAGCVWNRLPTDLKLTRLTSSLKRNPESWLLTPSTPAVENCCRSKGSAPYWCNPPFLIFDIRALWRSVVSARAPECQKLKMVGYTSMAQRKALTESAVKGLTAVN